MRSSTLVMSPDGKWRTVFEGTDELEEKMVYDEIVIEALKTAKKVNEELISAKESEIVDLQKKNDDITKKISDMVHD